MGQKLLWPQLEAELAQLEGSRKIVFTNGCFDLLHVGHVRYLQAARALGTHLIVALNTDRSVQVLKGPARPIQKEQDRAEILAALECVSYALLFDEETPEALIKKIKPDVLVKGGDWKVDQIAGGAFVQSYGGEVKSLQFHQGHSTTTLIEKSQNRAPIFKE